jgi:hypothetical protein
MKGNRFTPKLESDAHTDIVDQIVKKERQRETEGDTHRVNFNMPKFLHELVQDKIRKKGYNLTSYLLTLVRKDLGED